MESTNIKKEPFYIFTDIDGVLFDNESAFYAHGPFLKDVSSPVLKHSSVVALNFLLETLEKKYDTKFIITSPRRKDLVSCMQYLNYNGLKYNKPIFATDFVSGPRGKKILNLMSNDGLVPKKKPSLKQFISNFFDKNLRENSFKNYVVIDSSLSHLKRLIPKEHIIKTNFNYAALSIDQVINFLNSIGIDITYDSSRSL